MNKAIKSTFLLFAMLTMASCGTNQIGETSDEKKEETPVDLTVKDSDIKAGYTRYDIKSPLARKTEGLGAQFDTCILDPNNSNITDWEIISNAVRTSNLQAVRIRFYPEMYERGNDNNDPNSFDYNSNNVDFNSLEMQHLYKLLDLMEENHVNVDLSWYGCRTTFESEDGKIHGSWLGGTYGSGGINGWMAPPNSKYCANPEAEFSESVAACLNYLINVKKYTCLYEYSIFPEPEGVISDMTMYGTIAKMIKTNLAKYDLKGKILFSGPADYGNNYNNLKTKYLDKDYGYDKVDSSVYAFHGEMTVNGGRQEPSSNESMLEFAKGHVKVCEDYGTSWGVAESGTSNFLTAVTNADTEVYDRAITMTRFFINLTNAGCTNIKYFIFSDCSYDGTTNKEGLFRFAKSYYADSEIDYQAKPIWYAWSLLMRYSDIGSIIHPVTDTYEGDVDKDICITSLKLPDGSWSYFMANLSSSSKKVALANEFEGRPSSMSCFRLTAASTPSGKDATLKIIDKQEYDIDTSKGIAHVSIPANGIIVLSNKK